MILVYKAVESNIAFAFFTPGNYSLRIKGSETSEKHWSRYLKNSLFVTLFAFPGVNMFLSGLHFHGER